MGKILQARRAAARKKTSSGRVVRTSTYGNDPKTGYVDSGDNNRPASGIPNKYPAVAIGMDRSKLGKFVEYTPTVGKYKGQTLVVRVGDLGPAGWTGKGADNNAVFARLQGLPQGNRYPTGSKARLGRVYAKPPKGAAKVTNGLYVLGGPVKAPKAKSKGTPSSAKSLEQPSAVDTAPLGEVPDIAQSSGLAEQVMQRQTQAPPFTLPADPWFTARAKIRSATGATQLPSLQPMPAEDNGLSAQLADAQARTSSNPFLPPQSELGAVQGTSSVPDAPGVDMPKEKKPKEPKAAKVGRRSSKLPGGVVTYGKGWGGSQGVADLARKTAGDLGMPITSEKRQNNSVSGGVSDHWVGAKGSYALDIATSGAGLDRAAKALARRYGIRGPVVGTFARYPVKVGNRKYSVQILSRVEGHYDHVHIGFKLIG